MEHKYIVVQTTYKNGDATRIAFGIAAVEEYDGITTILESISDLTPEIRSVERLVILVTYFLAPALSRISATSSSSQS